MDGETHKSRQRLPFFRPRGATNRVPEGQTGSSLGSVGAYWPPLTPEHGFPSLYTKPRALPLGLSHLSENPFLKSKKQENPFVGSPASRKIYCQAIAEGIMDTLAEAGAMITHPGCGLCCGRAGGILTDGERVVATNNRNFLGRMGTSKVEIYLASPKTAAACAIAGKIVNPEK